MLAIATSFLPLLLKGGEEALDDMRENEGYVSDALSLFQILSFGNIVLTPEPFPSFAEFWQGKGHVGQESEEKELKVL